MMYSMAKGKVGLGRTGELLVVRALHEQGYEIVAQNWQCPHGEVDVVARHGEHLYFIEVRTRRSLAEPLPEHSLTQRKLARMEIVARTYLGTHVSERQFIWHLSFAAVAMDRAGRLRRITFYPDPTAPPEELLHHA